MGQQYSRKGKRVSCGLSQQYEGDAEKQILLWETLSGCCEEDARGSYSIQRYLVDTWDLSQYPQHSTLEQLYFENDLDKLKRIWKRSRKMRRRYDL